MLVCLAIIAVLMTLALDQYLGYVAEARVARAREDLERVAQAIRLYNTREEVFYEYKSFIPLVGTYLLEPPPRDPWGAEYLLEPQVGIVYSRGPNGIDERADPLSDDLSRPFLPTEILLKEARFLDANGDRRIHVGDTLVLAFTRPIWTPEPLKPADFLLSDPTQSLGSAEIVRIPENRANNRLHIRFKDPVPPHLLPGTVEINLATDTLNKIIDLSTPPRRALLGPSRKIVGGR